MADVTVTDFQEGQWWLHELDVAAADGRDDLKRAVAVVRQLMKVAHSTVGQQQPVLYASPKQLTHGLIAGKEDPEDEAGIYLPVRRTPAGNFTMPLYAGPQPKESDHG